MSKKERIVNKEEKPEDIALDLTLRPRHLKEFIGQEKIKKNLDIYIQAARTRKDPLEHVLLSGPSGIGKTTLSYIIAREMRVKARATTGPAIERPGDLAAILTNLQENEVLFIDEIHRLNRTIEEILYSAMEDFVLDIVVGKGPSAQTLRLELPRFTLVGATTKVNLLSSPLRNRFGTSFRLDFYQEEEIEEIVKRSARILGVDLAQKVASEIACRARRTPRIANRLLKRVRDYTQVKSNKGPVSYELAQETFSLLDIDEIGLDETDRKILTIIMDKFKGGPVGLNTIAAMISEEKETIEEVYEPFLLRLGFLARTPKGRIVTDSAYSHLGQKQPL